MEKNNIENKNERFEFTYSAEQQAEIERIRSKYLPKEDGKLQQLRKLDASVTQKATMISIMIGLTGCLLLGGGMSLVLVIGIEMLIPCLLLGVPGIAAMVAAFPLYKKFVEKERERIAPQILALTEELGQ